MAGYRLKNWIDGAASVRLSFGESSTHYVDFARRSREWVEARARNEHIPVEEALKRHFTERTQGQIGMFLYCLAMMLLVVMKADVWPTFLLVLLAAQPAVAMIAVQVWARKLERRNG